MKRSRALLLFVATAVILGLVVPGLWSTLRMHQALAALDGEDEGARAQARERLVAAGASAVRPLLDALTRPGRQNCEPIAEVLRAMPLDDLRDELGVDLGAPDADRRAAAARALGWIRKPGTEPWLVELLADEDETVVRDGVVALSFLGGPEARGHLERLLISGGVSVRGACAHGLGGLGDPDAIGSLERALGDPSEYVRSEAQKSLDQLRAVAGSSR